MSIVFVSVVVPDRMEVDTWRSYWPGQEMARRGHDAYVLGPGGEVATRGHAGADTIVIHATNHDVGLSGTVRWLKGSECGARAVYVQFDDDYRYLGLIQDTEDDSAHWYRQLSRDHRLALEMADGLIASTPQVAEAYADWTAGTTHVIRNYLPEWITRVPRRPLAEPTVGWFGMLGAHRRDIEWLGAAARDLTRFGVVGDWRGVQDITGRTLDYRVGIKPWSKLYRHLARFAVGIVPVVDDAFNRPKSWIKPLEFAAVGVPAVACWLPAYDELRNESRKFNQVGLGAFGHGWPIPSFFARSAEEMVWLANNMLAANPDTERLRQTVRERFTMETAGGDAWEKWAAEVGAS